MYLQLSRRLTNIFYQTFHPNSMNQNYIPISPILGLSHTTERNMSLLKVYHTKIRIRTKRGVKNEVMIINHRQSLEAATQGYS